MAFYNQQQPFFSPPVPFTGCIHGGLLEGKVITISGRVLPGTERFHINLQCGSRPYPSPDIAFHFNPRYELFQEYVVCNTYQGQQWGSEERKYEMPISRGCPFTLTIMVNRDNYMVSVNGSPFLDYKHRISISRVDTISVDGGVELNSIAFQDPTPQFAVQPTFAPPPAYTPAYTPPPSYAVPYKTVIPGGMYHNRTITIQGNPNISATRFHFNLRCTLGIAFQFNPRFDENLVVRNSFLNGKWGQEERGGGMPFHRGQPFMITLICEKQRLKVMVNGVLVFHFSHRVQQIQKIDILEVAGDVNLSSVSI
ncbi:galectin-9 isoform X2 [Amia ocellicauda]|uniref:galectin-9 isoform X2 n=1 Tax=Amia ocellicauda TaxID=2972642 RepID=UPI003464C00F